MRGEAMSLIMNQLNRMEIDIGSLKVLEFFARKGNWHTLSYANKVHSISAWEIEAKFKSDLRVNIPHSKIRIGNSFELAKEPEHFESFDLIVFDNPQGIYGEYCEHFECLNLTPDLMIKKGGLVIFNINKAPFNYNKESMWAKKRNKYYNVIDASTLDVDFLLDFYQKKFKSLGFKTIFSFETQRNKEYLSYLVFNLTGVY
ncbi:hypothetical protein N8773_00905 [Candidatus Pseudothioglobus singularis]|nr:hypothetical protein [Candidatus Pseudothioglobus singularis]